MEIETPGFNGGWIGSRESSVRKRAYRACINCRSRKAKCEFSGIDFKPPCLRCRREGKECIFVPSRRGKKRNASVANGRHLKEVATATTTTPTTANTMGSMDNDDTSIEPINNNETILEPTTPESRQESEDGSRINAESVVEANLRNPADALEILAMTSLNRDDPAPQHHLSPENRISRIELIQRGVIDHGQLRTFVSIFFMRHHHFLPFVPPDAIPTTDDLLAKFADEEPFLLATIVMIASRYESLGIHIDCWKYVREEISKLVMGGTPTVGAIEALLLISENTPYLPEVSDRELSIHEARLAWSLVGNAIRLSYLLGLDQKTLIPVEEVQDEEVHQQRLAWTYCYMHDRQASIRLGKAFWSRGPGLCFQNPPDFGISVKHDSKLNFPTLTRGLSPVEEGSATFVEALVELTQILTNIHDTLYPSRDRTIALVKIGDYYRILDEFTRTLNGYKIAWENEKWEAFPLQGIVWASYHYTKLYAYAFAFQAHVQRATQRRRDAIKAGILNPLNSNGGAIFPRGITGTADSKFILEAIKGASDLILICVNELFPGGALPYLPSRFYGYINYAAVFLIKVVFTDAVAAISSNDTMLLLERLIRTLMNVSRVAPDKQHSCVRSAKQIRTLIRSLLSAKRATVPNKMSNTHNDRTEDNSFSETTNMNNGDQPIDLTHLFDVNRPQLPGGQGGNNAMMEIPAIFEGITHERSDGETSEVGVEELTSLLSTDIDSEMWLSFLNQNG